MSNTTEDKKVKVKSIENSPEKNAVRTQISNQVEQYIDHTEQPELTLASLPAENWFFESMLQERLRNAKCTLKVFAAEFDLKTCIKAIRKMPSGCAIANMSFDELLTVPMRHTKSDLLVPSKSEEHTTPIKPHVIWADYCRPANVETLKQDAERLGRFDGSGLMYVTYCCKIRAAGGTVKYLKQFSKYSKAKDIPTALMESILHFCKANKIENVREVFNVVYGGGSNRSTTMVTLGFSVGLPAKAIEYVNFNRMTENHALYSKRYQTAMRIQTSGFPVSIGRPKSKGVSKTEQEKIRLRKLVFKRWKKGWDSKTISRDLGYKGIEISVGSVGAMIAHMNCKGSFPRTKAYDKL